jgi:hypothetical protein
VKGGKLCHVKFSLIPSPTHCDLLSEVNNKLIFPSTQAVTDVAVAKIKYRMRWNKKNHSAQVFNLAFYSFLSFFVPLFFLVFILFI